MDSGSFLQYCDCEDRGCLTRAGEAHYFSPMLLLHFEAVVSVTHPSCCGWVPRVSRFLSPMTASAVYIPARIYGCMYECAHAPDSPEHRPRSRLAVCRRCPVPDAGLAIRATSWLCVCRSHTHMHIQCSLTSP